MTSILGDIIDGNYVTQIIKLILHSMSLLRMSSKVEKFVNAYTQPRHLQLWGKYSIMALGAIRMNKIHLLTLIIKILFINYEEKTQSPCFVYMILFLIKVDGAVC